MLIRGSFTKPLFAYDLEGLEDTIRKHPVRQKYILKRFEKRKFFFAYWD
jgi:hypothetical protein